MVRIEDIIDLAEQDSDRGKIEDSIDAVYSALCGDFPGAVSIRHLYPVLQPLGVTYKELE